MGRQYKVCSKCGSWNKVELHHIIKRSQMPTLKDCSLNHVYLCEEHHRGASGVHGKNGRKLDIKLRFNFQEKLRWLFYGKEYVTKKDIREVLKISDKAIDKLCKTINSVDDKYILEDVIRRCTGSKTVLEGDVYGE